MPSIAAFIAANRFGFGARAEELQKIDHDPARWLLGQMDIRHAPSVAFAGLPATAEIVQNAMGQLRQLQKMKNTGDAEENRRKLRDIQREIRGDFIEEAAARTRAAILSPAPFFERMVHFWSNHFTVSATKRQSLPLVAAFERDVIRPHVLGKFSDMLLAAVRHPAMLTYLDNARSIGPNSRSGKRQGKGLNENLAREIFELHTLGVNGGYTQDDVIALAKMLTGWSVDILATGNGNGFLFNNQLHEPGEKTLLGIVYPENGEAEARNALYNLSQHPACARFIAGKIAKHFISDMPSAAAVQTLAQSFLRGGGNLTDVYRTLISLPEVWQNPLGKIKTPNDYIISLMRVAGEDISDIRLAGAFRDLGQIPFSAPSPAGWSDMGKDWLGGEALLRRIGIAQNIAEALHTRLVPADVLEATIGPVASETTRSAVRRAGSPAEALTLVFSSPEFQRR